MHNQSYWLDRFKEAKGFTSDYKLGKHWAKHSAQISQMRSGKTKLTFGACLEIAETLSIDPIEILAALEFQRTEDEYERDIIKKHFFRRFGRGLTVIFMTMACGMSFMGISRSESVEELNIYTSHNIRICTILNTFYNNTSQI